MVSNLNHHVKQREFKMGNYNQIKNQRANNKLNRKIDLQEKRRQIKHTRKNDVRHPLGTLPVIEVNEEVVARIAGNAIANIVEGKAPITNMFVLMMSMAASVNQTVEAAEAGSELHRLG
jgi:hypothetical protein